MLLNRLRERIGGAVAAAIGAVFFFVCGAVLAFVISPQQAVEWRKINNLPEMTASSLATTQTGEDVVITGTLVDNATLNDDDFVAYIDERWEVEPPDPESEDDTPDGSWETLEKRVPALTLSVSGGTVATVADNGVSLGGSLYEVLTETNATLKASYDGRQLGDGSERIRGFRNGDLVTVYGTKASTGGIAPKRIFGGDRVQLVEDIRGSARAAFMAGIGMMICAPIVLVGGILASLFGRRRRGI